VKGNNLSNLDLLLLETENGIVQEGQKFCNLPQFFAVQKIWSIFENDAKTFKTVELLPVFSDQQEFQ
jgi:hypothetical protein